MRRLSPLLWVLAAPLAATTFTVTNTSDSGPGSLRQAIQDANANPGLDTIQFDIPASDSGCAASGVCTIAPATPLPDMSDPVILDGYTQPGAMPNSDAAAFDGKLLIELSGVNTPNSAGLVFTGGGSTIRGIVINRYTGTAGDAIHLLSAGGNHVEGNFIGADSSGTLDAGNGDDAIVIEAGSNDNAIGGPAPAQRNVISANKDVAFFIATSGNVIRGNLIGTQKDGVSPLGNFQGIGFVGSSNTANDNVVGGIGPGEANVIAFSTIRAVLGEVASGTGNIVRGNSIHDNGGLGIDWVPVGPTPNDAGDADTGMNDYQNFPIIQSVQHLAPQGGSTEIAGKLDSAASTTYDLDFYANAACSNFPREFLQGRQWLGTTQVTTDAGGHAAFDVTFPVSTETGARISATATDPNGNTSEFSQRIIFSIDVTSGPASGGTSTAIRGTDFSDPTAVTVGGVTAAATFQDTTTLAVTIPPLQPGTVNDVVATTPDGTTGTLVKGWVADFLDVDDGNQFYSFVTTLVSNAITVGVGGGLYGVNDATLRQQMAVFLLKAKHGLCYSPPPCQGDFQDVPCPSTFADWVEALAAEGISGGCGNGNFCPTNPVRRDQMAPFLLKAEHGSSYTPPACAGAFADVACPSLFADWIEQLAAEQITGGCGGGNYCPSTNSTRGQMAVFVVKTFKLQ